MSFLDSLFGGGNDALSFLGIGMQIAGGVAGLAGAKKQADAFEEQSAFQLQLGQEKAQWARELAATEASLLLDRGEDQATIAAWNEKMAIENAIFAERAGVNALEDSTRRWSENYKLMTAQFAANGVLLTDTPTAVLAEQSAEAAKDAYRIRLSTEAAVAKARGEADIFSFEGARARAMAKKQADARLIAGEIESRSSLLSSQIGSDAAMTQAETARIGGFTSLLGAGAAGINSYLTYSTRTTPRTAA